MQRKRLRYLAHAIPHVLGNHFGIARTYLQSALEKAHQKKLECPNFRNMKILIFDFGIKEKRH